VWLGGLLHVRKQRSPASAFCKLRNDAASCAAAFLAVLAGGARLTALGDASLAQPGQLYRAFTATLLPSGQPPPASGSLLRPPPTRPGLLT